jgi:two-component system, cell cycle response regulator
MISTETIHVLLADSSGEHRALITQHLGAKFRYRVDAFADGASALDAFKENPEKYQVGLIDYQLTDMTGLDLMRRIGSINRFFPIVVVTASGSEIVAVELMKAGAKDYIIKQSDYQKALHVTIDQVIEKQKFEVLNFQFQRQLEERANKDFLTGVYNRHRFTELFEREIATAERYKRPISAAMIDVDKFKQINDQYGHKMGDYALVSISDLLKSQLRTSDIIGRFGGDEFVVVMPETDLEQAVLTFQRIGTALDSFNSKKLFPSDLSLSVGLADNQESYTGLIDRADMDMYKTKMARKTNRTT